jgi:serine protease
MRLFALFSAAVAALLAFPALGAERAPAPRAVLAPLDGEVIVRFKPDASVLRRHVLAARAEAPTVRRVLAQRAQGLGQRVGRALETGEAVGTHTQVMRAVGIDAATLAAVLRADSDVESAEPNYRRRILAAPNDPLYAAAAPGVRPSGPDAGQWYLRQPTAEVASSIDIEAAWAVTRGLSSVVVAVLDTGVRFEHPDLGQVASGGSGRLLQGYDFVADVEVANDGSGRDGDPSDPGDWTSAAENSDPASQFYQCDPGGQGDAEITRSSWHGTATASLVGAATDNNIGMAGTAPLVSVLPVRVLGKCFGRDSDIQAAMRWAAGIPVDGVPDNQNPAKVLNLSLGGGVDPCNSLYQSVVNQVIAAGAVIVAAAGNSEGGAVGSPANCPGVIAVMALRHVGTKVGFSDLGPEITIAAPGGNCVLEGATDPCLYPILAATNDGLLRPGGSGWTDSFDITVGTSFASPLVAGTVGLMFSATPSLTPGQIKTALSSSARPFPTTGADNGSDPTPVPMCRAPDGAPQLQCYCNTSVCGAGMLDAGAAVLAATQPVVDNGPGTIEVPPAAAPADDDGGGGAMSALWVLLLGVAAVAVRRRRPT